MRNISTEIIIDAPAKDVWDILMDHESYPGWNPFIKKISGSTNVGEHLAVTVRPIGQSPMNFKPEVLVHKKYEEFRWIGKLLVRGLFDGEHFFLLEGIGPDKTRFVQGENFTGILSGMFFNRIEQNTKMGFESMNYALKEKSESK